MLTGKRMSNFLTRESVTRVKNEKLKKQKTPVLNPDGMIAGVRPRVSALK
jgi:hypothetical protein